MKIEKKSITLKPVVWFLKIIYADENIFWIILGIKVIGSIPNFFLWLDHGKPKYFQNLKYRKYFAKMVWIMAWINNGLN